MKNLKLSFDKFKKNEIPRVQLITVLGGEEDPGDNPKTGTTTNTGIGVAKTGQDPVPLSTPLP